MLVCPRVSPLLAMRILCLSGIMSGGVAILPASADLPPLIPRAVLFGNPAKTSPKISPDGQRLAYLAPNNQQVLNVWVRTIGQQDDHLVTADTKRGIYEFFWQGDSDHILYLQDQDGDENYHLYQTDLKTKNIRDLTPWQGVTTQIVSLNLNYPDQLLVGMNLRTRQTLDVYRLNLRTGAIETDTENPGDVLSWLANNKLQVRVAQAFLPDGSQEIRVRNNEKSPWRVIQKWGPDESMGGLVGFSPDNKRIYLTSSEGGNTARLLEIDPRSGKSRVLSEDAQYDIGSVMQHPVSHKLEAVAYIRARNEWTLLDPAIQADFEAVQKGHTGDFSIVSRDRKDKTWIVSYVLDNGPVSFYTYDRSSKRAELLFSDRPALETYTLAPTQPVSFTARDGMPLSGYLTLPVGVPPQNLPALLLVHGGPWGRDVWGLDPMLQLLANRGYAVLQINFRGSTGYGKTHLNAGNREWGGKMHDDLIDGKHWIIQQGYADPSKVAIMGGSYGGYATLVGLTFTPEAFVCGVELFGPSHLVTLLNNPPPYWAPFMAFIFKRVGHPKTEVPFLESRSPLLKADRIIRPLLIAQGANDVRVKQQESDQIVAAMRKNGKPVEYLVFPDEGHGFARPENNLKFMAAAEAFLSRYLGGRAEPPAEAEKVDALRR